MEISNHHLESIVPYLVARIRQCLAEDARTNLLDVQVKVRAGKLFLLGRVESQERRRAAEEVARESVPPGTPIVNDLLIFEYMVPPDEGENI